MRLPFLAWVLWIAFLPACADKRPARIAPASAGVEESVAKVRAGVTVTRKRADEMARTALTSDLRDFAEEISFSLQDVERENERLVFEHIKYKADVAKQTQQLDKVSGDLNTALDQMAELKIAADRANAALWRRNWFIIALLVWVFRTPLLFLGRGALRFATGLPL